MPQTILIADEEPVAALTLGAVFEKSGYRVLRASTAQRAFEAFRSASVDIVIMDDQLEGAHPLGRRLKHLRPSLPLVVFSSVPMEQDAAASFADVFVPKPENPRRLLQTVAALLENASRYATAESSDARLRKAA